MSEAFLQRLSLALPVLLVLAAPVAAFDDIDRFLPLIGLDEAAPVPFSYAAVTEVRGVAVEGFVALASPDRALNAAIGNPAASAATGIDFAAVTAVFSAGAAPKEITVIFGEPGFARAAPEILAAKGYALTTEPDGATLLSRGEDFVIDLLASDDPLGSGLGKAQRLLMGEDYILRTAATPLLRLAEEALMSIADRPETVIWRNLFDIVESASGSSPSLDAASGYVGPSVFGDTYLVMAATHAGNLTTAHLAMTLPGFSECEGTPPLPADFKTSLKALADPNRGLRSETTRVDDTCYGVLSLDFDPDQPMGALTAYGRRLGL